MRDCFPEACHHRRPSLALPQQPPSQLLSVGRRFPPDHLAMGTTRHAVWKERDAPLLPSPRWARTPTQQIRASTETSETKGGQSKVTCSGGHVRILLPKTRSSPRYVIKWGVGGSQGPNDLKKKKWRGGEKCAYVHRELFLEWDTEGAAWEKHTEPDLVPDPSDLWPVLEFSCVFMRAQTPFP